MHQDLLSIHEQRVSILKDPNVLQIQAPFKYRFSTYYKYLPIDTLGDSYEGAGRAYALVPGYQGVATSHSAMSMALRYIVTSANQIFPLGEGQPSQKEKEQRSAHRHNVQVSFRNSTCCVLLTYLAFLVFYDPAQLNYYP